MPAPAPNPTKLPPDDEARALRDELARVLADIERETARAMRALESVPESRREDAENLLAYVALRRHELRPLQEHLAAFGLSSLGRVEGAVTSRIRTVLDWLDLLLGGRSPTFGSEMPNLASARTRLVRHAADLFGPPRHDRRVRILATVDASLADDPRAAIALLRAGVDAFRINAAHDEPATWDRIVATVRRAGAETRSSPRILVDLPGPKLRTGPIVPGPAVVRLRPVRDALGHVVDEARAHLVPLGRAAPGPIASLPLDPAFVAKLAPGDVLHVVDARGRKRRLVVETTDEQGASVATNRTAYLVEGLELRCERQRRTARIGPLPATEGVVPLAVGDALELTIDGRPGRPARPEHGEIARVDCPIPELVRSVHVGQRVVFDDGRLETVVRERHAHHLRLEVTRTRKPVFRLRGGKGINLPDTELPIAGFTEADERILAWAATKVDAIGLSFTQSRADVERLAASLDAKGASHVGVVPKIETRAGFERLPEILLATMHRRCSGVMIARGDLAVECGFERLAEVQEEILWLAEAAHVPVIWATEVLDQLAHSGLPSRAEITDAAMGERAECVMLNKGPHLALAARTLDDILRRMEAHQSKKSSMLRRLSSF